MRQLPAHLNLSGDEGLAALVAPPPPPSGALPPTGVLTKLKRLFLNDTQITNAGCAAFASALDSGALPVLEELHLFRILANTAARSAVYQARDRLKFSHQARLVYKVLVPE